LKAFFAFYSGPISPNFSRVFRFRCSVGRGSQAFANSQPLFSKIINDTFRHWSEWLYFTICSPICREDKCRRAHCAPSDVKEHVNHQDVGDDRQRHSRAQ
jgi:hypothetical protein